MKKSRKFFGKVVSAVLVMILLLNLISGCGKTLVNAQDLMGNVKADRVKESEIMEEDNVSVTDFAVRLFRQTLKDKKNGGNDDESTEEGNTGNVLISPLSVVSALAMTANGASGETLNQMEEVLGLPMETLNEYLYTYIIQLPQTKKSSLHLANSIWFTNDESVTIKPEFLQTNANYYGADIYQTSFDKALLDDINQWVNENTDGMIPKILEDIPDEAIMYLVNALAFEAEWSDIYEDRQVRDGVFTTEVGERQEVKMMYASEEMYLEDENATGFIKYYKGRSYAFAALLPKV